MDRSNLQRELQSKENDKASAQRDRDSAAARLKQKPGDKNAESDLERAESKIEEAKKEIERLEKKIKDSI